MSLKSTCSKVWTGVKVVASVVLNVYAILAVMLFASIFSFYSKYSSIEQPYTAHEAKDAVLKITLQAGEFSEHSYYGTAVNRWDILFGDSGSRATRYSFAEYMAALRYVPDDKNVKGVVVELDDSIYNNAQAYELQQRLRDIRDAGKPVVVYVNGTLVNNDLLVVSAASKRFVAPGTFVRPVRPTYGANFEKGFYDKFDIDFIGQRMSLYKDFILKNVKYQVDQDVKSTFDSQYEIYQTLMNQVAENYNEPVTKFDLDDNQLMTTFKSTNGNLAQAFKKAGWYDDVLTPDAFDEYVAKNIAHLKNNEKIPNYISINSYTLAQKYQLFSRTATTTEKHIAYLALTGDVVYSGNSNDVISMDNTIKYLRSIYYNANNVEALVLRVDSPGGSVFTGSNVRSLLGQIRAKGVPIIVSQGFLAASAGYMISSAADYIYTTPITITGSIGVVVSGYNLSRMLENFKVRSDTKGVDYAFGGNSFKIPFFMGGYSNPYPELEKSLYKASITSNYHEFLTQVYEGRKSKGVFKSIADVNKVAQGHSWGGVDAMALGLVDGFGDVYDAIGKAREYIIFTQKDRKDDKFSPGKFEVLTGDQVAHLPVIFYNANYGSRFSGNSILTKVLSKVDTVTGGYLANAVQELDAKFSNDDSQVAQAIIDSNFVDNKSSSK